MHILQASFHASECLLYKFRRFMSPHTVLYDSPAKATCKYAIAIQHFIYFQSCYASDKFNKASASNKITFIPSDF